MNAERGMRNAEQRRLASCLVAVFAIGLALPLGLAAQRPMRAARRRMRCVHAAHSPPMAIPGVSSPQLLHGWLGPTGHGARKLGG